MSYRDEVSSVLYAAVYALQLPEKYHEVFMEVLDNDMDWEE